VDNGADAAGKDDISGHGYAWSIVYAVCLVLLA